MAIPNYFAMTAAEFAGIPTLPEKVAWMACHFSSSGNGLSNLPSALPASSMLILDDSFPPSGHDPALVAQQLHQCARALHCDCILLDLQRPARDEAAVFVSHILQDPPCPVGLPPDYARPGFPVFLPPVPLDTPIEAYLAPWDGHEIWLEAALNTARFRVDAKGCIQTPIFDPVDVKWQDASLSCHYGLDMTGDHIDFILQRTPEDLSKLLKKAEALGVSKSIALWQELNASSISGGL